MNFDILKTSQFYNLEKIRKEIFDIFSNNSYKSIPLSGVEENFDMNTFHIGPLRDTDIKEADFKFLHPSLKGTEIENIWIQNKKSIGRFRILILKPSESYSLHVDADYRYHLAVTTNNDAFLEIDGKQYHIPDNGYAYLCNTRKTHRAYNNGTEDRIHLVWNDRNCE